MTSSLSSASRIIPRSARSLSIDRASGSFTFHIFAALEALKGLIGNNDTRPASRSEKRILSISKRRLE